MTKRISTWPVLRTYHNDQLNRIAMPIGGIGTGTISLGGRGNLQDWEIVNRPAKKFGPPVGFFTLWCKPAGGESVARLLEGPMPEYLLENGFGHLAPGHGLPRFRNCSFDAAYPLAQVNLSDPDVPLRVRMEAFNPMIPGNDEDSGLPVAALRFVLINKSSKAVSAGVCGSIQNFIGADGANRNIAWYGGYEWFGDCKGNRNEVRAGDGLTGLLMSAGSALDPTDERWGTIALSTQASAGVSHRTAWSQLAWGDSLLDFWDDFSADGRIEERDAGTENMPVASLASGIKIPPRSQRAITFYITWHFPNRLSWSPVLPLPGAPARQEPVGNYYATHFTDAWDAATKIAPRMKSLEAKTVEFVRALVESDLPDIAKEAALFNTSTLRTQTCFRTKDGRFYGWEGCGEQFGACWGNCTHVWSYEHASGHLFGKLARSMRVTEFGHCTDERGMMSFRVNLPLERAREFNHPAADGQMGSILRLYRDFRLCGDEAWLLTLWPYAKRAMEYAWLEGGWDPDQDGVMDGCQHNTMDVEYYGPNPEINVLYLGALRAIEEMAKIVGDAAFAAKCRSVFQSGSRKTDEMLFNGEYYEHKIVPPAEPDKIMKELRFGMGSADLKNPTMQIGPGCLIDQLVGQYTAHVCDLGHLLDPKKIRSALRAVRKYNYRPNLFGHFNHMRTYAAPDEQGTLTCTYPRGGRPKQPFPYANEVWTGLEYTLAAGLIQEGMIEDGIKTIEAARSRHDGRRRNPFDEPECGHHYTRAMSSWTTVLALTGFAYNARDREIKFNPSKKPSRWFFSTGDAWGVVRQKPDKAGAKVEITVMGGQLALTTVTLRNLGSCKLRAVVTLTHGKPATCVISPSAERRAPAKSS